MGSLIRTYLKTKLTEIYCPLNSFLIIKSLRGFKYFFSNFSRVYNDAPPKFLSVPPLSHNVWWTLLYDYVIRWFKVNIINRYSTA